MSFDLFPDESNATLLRAARNPSLEPVPGFWTGFLPGAASITMEGFAKTARAIDLLGAVGPMTVDALTGGTSEQDRYFKEHDDVFNRAVDYWTPAPGDVGTAGRVVGAIAPILAQVAVSPALAVGTAELGAAEDLVRQNIEARKAVGVGIVQGTGLGLGIYLPIFGTTLATRALVAGAGSNVAQGIVTRAASRKILEGTTAEKQFDPWDAESIVIDGLLGIGFGSLVHLGKAPGDAAYREMIESIRARMTESDKAAILVANQARHIEDTTAPGSPLTDVDRTLHAAAMRKAIDDVLNGRPADVEQILADTKFADDPNRVAAQAEVMRALEEEARAMLPPTHEIEPLPRPAPKGEEAPPVTRRADLGRYLEVSAKAPADRTPEEVAFLKTFEGAKPEDFAAPPPKAAAPKAPAGEKATPTDPVVTEALQRLEERGEPLLLTDENGKTTDMREELDAATAARKQAEADAKVFEAAAQCYLGML